MNTEINILKKSVCSSCPQLRAPAYSNPKLQNCLSLSLLPDKNCINLFSKQLRLPLLFFLTRECAEFCVIGQKFVGVFIYEEHSDSNGGILLQLFCF